MRTEQYGTGLDRVGPTIACIEGDHEGCDGEHPRVGNYTGPMPQCGCGCHIEPWPFPCAEDRTGDPEPEPESVTPPAHTEVP